MIRKLMAAPKRKLNAFLLSSILSSSLAHVFSETQSPSWSSTNQIFQKHPRLQFLHQCSSRDRLESLLSYAVVSGLFQNPFVASHILHASTLFSSPSLTFASSIFASLDNPNIFSFNTMIKFDPSATWSLCVEMLGRGTHTFPFLLKSLNSSAPVLNLGKVVHAHVLVFRFEADPFVQTALMSMCFACQARDDALHLFDGIRQRDVVTWTAALSGLAVQVYHAQALYVFNAMRSQPENSNVSPNVATMVSAMLACAGNLELTKLVLKKIETTCMYNGGAHVLLSNIFADQNQWHEVVSIRESTRRDESKPQGQSWIEVRGTVDEFGVEDKSDPLARGMHLVLDEQGKLMQRIHLDFILPFYWCI